MAVRHRLTVESCRLGHVVTCGSRRAVARNWGGKGEPTAAGQRIETLWRQFFSDPSQWWDCWSENATARYPDFKHKMTQHSLWIGHLRNPPWVDAKLAAMAPGTVQLDRFSWNRSLARYGKAGQHEKTIALFQEGMCFCASMKEVHMISPTMEHYTCMVNLLGHAGHLQEAENMIKSMPCKPHFATCMALLSACRIHGNVEMGECVAQQVIELESENAAGYVLLANIYAASGNRHLCEDVEQQRKERGVKRQPGCTWIEVDNKVHTFLVDDQDHPQMVDICAELKRLSVLMHDAQYVPHTTIVLHDVEEEEKVFRLCHHSEKLAIAF